MAGKLLLKVVIFSIVSGCFSQDTIPRPTFPEVFQTEIEGTFMDGNAVVEMDGSMFFDRPRNRAALFFTKEGGTTKLIFNFDQDESLSIDDDSNKCEVNPIPEEQGFFPYKSIGGKKIMSEAAEALYFTKEASFDSQSLSMGIPTLLYRSKLSIPQFGQPTCELIHIFSKPDLELPTCKEGIYCNSTIMSLSVECKNGENTESINHVYRFYRFSSGIEDESVFLPPPGIHCDSKSSRDIPKFPSYFSFNFDIVEMQAGQTSVGDVTHKEVWYDANFGIIRIDEYGAKDLLLSSKIFDMKTGVDFTIIATDPICAIGTISDTVKLDEVTRLPKSFFIQNDSSVYVGKRKVHGLDYDVWSLSWKDSDSAAIVTEEIHYLQIVPIPEMSMKPVNKEPYFQLSHVDIYTYEEDDSGNYAFVQLKHYSINNYRSKPKELAAFDVLTCFSKKDTMAFSLNVNAPPLVKRSQSYNNILELLYSKIITATGVSVVRISELQGVFDGTKLLEIKGTILDNSESIGWPKGSREPRMAEVFKSIKKAASENRLSVSYLDENNKELTVKVTFVEEFEPPPDSIPRPTFPEVFQTEIEATFMDGDAVVEMDGSLFFDRPRNRAALFFTKEGGTTKLIFNFDQDESLSIDDDSNKCEVNPIPEEQGFFPYKLIGGKKIMSEAAEALYFTKEASFDSQSLSMGIPSLLYRSKLSIPQFGQPTCELIHIFSKPDLELPMCKEGIYCNSTIMSLSVECENGENTESINRVFRFYRFSSGIEDESVFLPPPGIHCDTKSSRDIPKFPSYFSFNFDIVEKQAEQTSVRDVTHKEVWYDANFRIIRIDEYGAKDLLLSSKIFDMNTGVDFTIIATDPICAIGPISDTVKLDKETRLPKSFFIQNDSSVYVGKRKVHGLDYDVWSLSWTDSDSAAIVTEEIHYLQIVPIPEMSMKPDVNTEPYFQLSHVDIYTYEEDDSRNYAFVQLKHYSINNYRSKPKELAAFDVLTCFSKKDTMAFSLNVNAPPLVKGSQSYNNILELLYNKIITATGVSVVRISELQGVFDGTNLLEIKGTILDNSESIGWPKGSREPGMAEVFKSIKKAASDNRLSVSYLDESNKKLTVKVTSVEEFVAPPDPKDNCYSGSSMAAASLILLLIGVFFGIAGYYVFLKKRRPANINVKMSDLHE